MSPPVPRASARAPKLSPPPSKGGYGDAEKLPPVRFKILEAASSDGSKWWVCCIEEGFSANPGNLSGGTRRRYYTPEAIQKAVDRKVLERTVGAYQFIGQWYDHLPEGIDQSVIGNAVGVISDSRVGKTDDGRLTYEALLSLAEAGLANQIRSLLTTSWAAGVPDVVGLSIDAYGVEEPRVIEGEIVDAVVDIPECLTVDIVNAPAAGGKFLRLAASNGGARMVTLLLKLLESFAPGFAAGLTESSSLEAITGKFVEAMKRDPATIAKESKRPLALGDFAELSRASESIQSGKVQEAEGILASLLEAWNTAAAAPTPTPAPVVTPPPAPAPAAGGQGNGDEATRAAESRRNEEIDVELTQMRVDRLLNSATTLGDKLKESVRGQFRGKRATETDIQREINRCVDIQGAALADSGVRDCGATRTSLIESGMDELGKMKIGLFKLFDLKLEEVNKYRRPNERSISESDWTKGARFKGINPAYVRYTGDESCIGEVSQDGISKTLLAAYRNRESVAGDTFAVALGDTIHRRALRRYAFLDDGQWKAVCEIVPASDFKDMKVFYMGGYNRLEVVAPGDPYPLLTTPGEFSNSYAVAKRGGREVIYLEAIRNDDTKVIAMLMDSIGDASWDTKNAFVWDIFLGTGSGTPNTVALPSTLTNRVPFNNTDKTLIAGQLSWPNAWDARIMVGKHAQEGSGRIINLEADTLIFESDLEAIAAGISDSQDRPDVTNRETNTLKGKFTKLVKVAGYLRGTGQTWGVACSKYPPLEFASLDGADGPVIRVSPVDALFGTGFTNDQMTIRVHDIYGAVRRTSKGNAMHIE